MQNTFEITSRYFKHCDIRFGSCCEIDRVCIAEDRVLTDPLAIRHLAERKLSKCLRHVSLVNPKADLIVMVLHLDVVL